MSRKGIVLLACSILAFLPSWSDARPDADYIETGRLLAILLDCGRLAIDDNQALINDPSKGNKGFTPAVFERQLRNIFKQRTGIDLSDLQHAKVPDMAKPLLSRLVEESKATVASYQPAINIPGIRYKGLIPATFGTETSLRFQKWSGIYLKQTAPPRLLRNPKNKPDDFEVAALQKLAESSSMHNGQRVLSETVDGGKAVRILLPLFYDKKCLACHGEPKGERDISGYAKEGGKEGDLGGAISVKLNLTGLNSGPPR
jgi:general secretion pathway protein A